MASRALDLTQPAMEDLVITDVLAALADPARLAIVRRVSLGPADGLMCAQVGSTAPKSTRSHQLKVLREAGVLRSIAHGRQRLLSVRRCELDERFPGLMGAVLADQDRLRGHPDRLTGVNEGRTESADGLPAAMETASPPPGAG